MCLLADSKVDVIIPEYRSYSLLQNMKPSVTEIQMDMVNLIQHLLAEKVIELSSTVLFSRSIGCMFLTYLSAIYKFKACIMYYPFSSVKGVVRSKFGSIAAFGIQENDF